MSSAFQHVERAVSLPVRATAAYAWHVRPGPLHRFFPPGTGVHILDSPSEIDVGLRTRMRIQYGPLVRDWVVQYDDVEPGLRLAVRQVEGPFASWSQAFEFVPTGPESCRLVDRIEYTLPVGLLGAAGSQWVPEWLERAVNRHQSAAREALAAQQRYRDRPRLRVAISGASGLVGSALADSLASSEHQVLRIVRRAPKENEVAWQPDAGIIDAPALEGLDAVIHLSGENVAARRWSEGQMARIRSSRVESTTLMAETLASLAQPPRVFVTASAVGIYGDRGEEELSESAAPGKGFLAEVGQAWEAATEPARAAGIRVVHLRLGIVLGLSGGALEKLVPLFRLGLGGRLGDGQQWMSWIALDDVVGAVEHILFGELTGPVNVVAPEPVRNAAFTATLARVVHRPALVPVPAPLLRAAVGAMADEALLASARVVPSALLESGYEFRLPELEDALRRAVGN